MSRLTFDAVCHSSRMPRLHAGELNSSGEVEYLDPGTKVVSTSCH